MAFSLHSASWMRGIVAIGAAAAPLLAVPILFSLLYWISTAALLRRRAHSSDAETKTLPELPELPKFPPVAFLRPIKHGLPALEEKAALLLQAARPGDWVLFGVATAADQRRCQQAIAAIAPAGVRAEALLCSLPGWGKKGASSRSSGATTPSYNPKIHKLEQLTAFLQRENGPEHWLLSDSELLAERPSFDRFRAEWHAAEEQNAQAGGKGVAFTAGYRFAGSQRIQSTRGSRNILQKLDHLPALLTLWPGLVATEWGKKGKKWAANTTRTTGLGFTLGACIGLRQREIARVGGWRPFRDYLAEDNRLGAALAAQGIPTHLSREVFTLEGDPLTLVDWVRHQHRVSFTYRVCNPLGFLGMALTLGVPWAMLLVLLHPHSWAAWGVLAFVLGVRLVTAASSARALAFPVEQRWPWFAGQVLIVSLVEAVFWIAAWLPLPVWWGNRAHRVTRDGKFSSGAPHFLETSLASEPALNYQSDV